METADTEFIKLSVQGVFLILKRDMVMSHDWILSKILTSDIPWDKTSDDGQYYIDVDPTSFRLIVSILTGITDLDSASQYLSTMDLASLKATTTYLMLESLTNNIKSIEEVVLDKAIHKQLEDTKQELEDTKQELEDTKQDLKSAQYSLKIDWWDAFCNIYKFFLKFVIWACCMLLCLLIKNRH